MAPFLNLSTLGFFLYYVVPGVVAIKIRNLIIPSEKENWTDSAITVITFSMLNLAVCFLFRPIINIPGLISNLSLDYFPTVLVVFVVPAIIGLASALIWKLPLLHKLSGGQLIDPIPSAWDHIFGTRNRRGYWMIIHLKSKQMIGGKYGMKSFTSSFPHPQDIYLEEIYRLDNDGHFKEKIGGTAGAFIKFEECSHIELFE